MKTRRLGEGLGFQGEASYLSNFHPATIRIEPYSFSYAEQAYQFFKLRTCKKEGKALEVLSMTKPRDIKLAGDSIPSTAIWEDAKEAFKRSIAFSKFRQNPDLQMKLLATDTLPLFECTKNRWWGCGWRLDDPEWNENKTPPGLNKMGQILMDVRAALRKNVYKEDALMKSPTVIIKSMRKMDEEIRLKAADHAAFGS